ncbi:cysteine-rich receptor-like protein kinase 26 [Bidens hawaiensis]|uniref:cysteine-rich receptor-like protein kinase 26 n=1 Tax=Bidens hawaiensis TaxID=980011 RepID=UPI0040492575
MGYGFYKSSVGKGNDVVNSIALCRGDVLKEEYCPYNKEAAIYYDQCTLVYYNKFWRVNLETMTMDKDNASHSDPFRETLRTLLDELIKNATSSGVDYISMFSSGNKSMADATSIYGLLQCTPNLSEKDCSYCFKHSMFVKF